MYKDQVLTSLVFATGNKNKLSEATALFGDSFNIKSLESIAMEGDIPEPYDQLRLNALNKAYFIYSKTGQACFAEDTGLEIFSLGMRPGVFSARYAGEGKNADENMNLVLQQLEGKTNRNAQFRTVVALYLHNTAYVFEGKVQGTISTKKLGCDGFGYDPIFIPEGFTKSFAQMTQDEKNTMSHRGRAFNNMIEFMKDRSDIILNQN